MKKTTVQSIRATVAPCALALAAGCSGDAASPPDVPDVVGWDGTPLTPNESGYYDVPPLPTEVDPSDPQKPYVMAKVTAGDATVEFISVWGDSGSGGPPLQSVIMRVEASVAEGNPVDRLREAAGQPLTNAEIYMGLTGEIPPTELVSMHYSEVTALGRASDEFLKVPGLGDPVVAKDLQSWVHVPVLGHTWVWPEVTPHHFCEPGAPHTCNPSPIQVVQHACATRAWPEYELGFPLVSDCKWNPQGWIRFGVMNDDIHSAAQNEVIIVQDWYRFTPSEPWRVNPAVAIGWGRYGIADWNTPQNKLYVAVINHPLTPHLHALVGTGWLLPDAVANP